MKPIRNGVILTWNRKCSCYQFNLPPRISCPGVKGRLKNPRSICNYCYAFHGRYGQMEQSQNILQHNLKAVRNCSERELIAKFKKAFFLIPMDQAYFRWFGCGDIVNRTLAKAILHLAEAHQKLWFWCPTQSLHQDIQVIPHDLPWNLTIRPTQSLIGYPAPFGGHTTLLPDQVLPDHFVCPGKCGECRRCWRIYDRSLKIAFPFHGSACLWAQFKKGRRVNNF